MHPQGQKPIVWKKVLSPSKFSVTFLFSGERFAFPRKPTVGRCHSLKPREHQSREGTREKSLLEKRTVLAAVPKPNGILADDPKKVQPGKNEEKQVIG